MSKPRRKSAEMQWRTNPDSGDVVCQHGIAIDVHCCNCHGGFLFDLENCHCELETGGIMEREKYWSELLDDEKIERMRMILKQQSETIQCLTGQLETLLRHRHLDNEIVTALNRSVGYEAQMRTNRQPDDDKVYF